MGRVRFNAGVLGTPPHASPRQPRSVMSALLLSGYFLSAHCHSVFRHDHSIQTHAGYQNYYSNLSGVNALLLLLAILG